MCIYPYVIEFLEDYSNKIRVMLHDVVGKVLDLNGFRFFAPELFWRYIIET